MACINSGLALGSALAAAVSLTGCLDDLGCEARLSCLGQNKHPDAYADSGPVSAERDAANQDSNGLDAASRSDAEPGQITATPSDGGAGADGESSAATEEPPVGDTNGYETGAGLPGIRDGGPFSDAEATPGPTGVDAAVCELEGGATCLDSLRGCTSANPANLVLTGGFDEASARSQWTGNSALEIAYDSDDATGCDDSGSLYVTSTSMVQDVRNYPSFVNGCIFNPPSDERYNVGALVKLSPNNVVRGEVRIRFRWYQFCFDAPSEYDSGVELVVPPEEGVWHWVHAEGLIPPPDGAGLDVELLVNKTTPDPGDFAASFDLIYVTPTPGTY